MRKILVIFLAGIYSITYSQVHKENPFFTIRGNIGIPRSVSSQMFRTSFKGVYDGNISANLKMGKFMFIGAGYQNSYFQNNKEVFVYYTVPSGQKTGGISLAYDTKMIMHGGFLKFGYDKFFEKGYITFALNVGYLRAFYTNVIEDSALTNQPFVPKNFSTPYAQPEVSINFLADKSVGFSIMLGYTTLFYKFDPKAPRFADVQQVQDSHNKYLISWINIGFGFNILIPDR